MYPQIAQIFAEFSLEKFPICVIGDICGLFPIMSNSKGDDSKRSQLDLRSWLLFYSFSTYQTTHAKRRFFR